MATSTEEITKLREEIKALEVSQAGQAASMAGAEATQAAAHAGTWSTMLSGAAGLVVGMFLGIAIVRSAHH
jgi:F0F1-type ATP synthase assembly protein I